MREERGEDEECYEIYRDDWVICVACRDYVLGGGGKVFAEVEDFCC